MFVLYKQQPLRLNISEDFERERFKKKKKKNYYTVTYNLDMYKILYFLIEFFCSVIDSLPPCRLFIKHIEEKFYLNVFQLLQFLSENCKYQILSGYDIFKPFHYDRIFKFCDRYCRFSLVSFCLAMKFKRPRKLVQVDKAKRRQG